MMAEQLVLWEHEQTETDLSLRQAWKKQGKLRREVYFFHVLLSRDFPFRLPLDYLPSSLLCTHHFNPEILGNPSLHCPCPWQHQCRGFLQSQRSKLCNPGPEVRFEHRYISRFFLIYAICPFQLITDTTSSMKLSSKYIGQSGTA